MTNDQIDRFRHLLLRQRDQLAQASEIRLDPLRDDVQDKVDDDLAPLNEMHQVIASNRNSSRTGSLRQIEEALRRLDRDPDQYGLCEDCDDEIPPRRLEVMPWTTLCVDCQSAREKPKAGGGRRHLTDYEDP